MRKCLWLGAVLLTSTLCAQEIDDLYFTSKDRKKKKSSKSGWVTRESVRVEKPDYSVDQEVIEYYQNEANELRESYRVVENENDEAALEKQDAIYTNEFNSQGFAINQTNPQFSQNSGYALDEGDTDDVYNNTYGNNNVYNDPYDPWGWNNNYWAGNMFPFQNSYFVPSYHGWGVFPSVYASFNPFWRSGFWGPYFYDPFWGGGFYNSWWGYGGLGYGAFCPQPAILTNGETNAVAGRARVNGSRVSRGGVVLGNESSGNRTSSLNRNTLSTPVDDITGQNSSKQRRSIPNSKSLQTGTTNRTQVNGNTQFSNAQRQKSQTRQIYRSNNANSKHSRPSLFNTNQSNRSNFNNRSTTPSRSFNPNRGSQSFTPNRSASPGRGSSNRSGGSSNRSSGNRKK